MVHQHDALVSVCVQLLYVPKPVNHQSRTKPGTRRKICDLEVQLSYIRPSPGSLSQMREGRRER